MAHYRYKKDTLTWTPTGGAAIALTGVQALSIEKDGTTLDLVADSAEVIRALPLFGLKASASARLDDQGQIDGLALGGGALAWQMEPLRTGRGSEGTCYQVSASKAVLRRIAASALSGAGGNLELGFEACDTGAGVIFSVVSL
jgi:hypothetical protein